MVGVRRRVMRRKMRNLGGWVMSYLSMVVVETVVYAAAGGVGGRNDGSVNLSGGKKVEDAVFVLE